MKSKNVVLVIVFLFLSNTVFSFWGKGNKENILRIGVTPVPQGEILKFVKKTFTNEKFELEIVEYSDYNQPNYDLKDGEVDVNYFQHQKFLDAFNTETRSDLISKGQIHFEKMGIYSNKVKSIKGISGKIAIPNDESNRIRALKLLEKSGLISLDENNIIVENPRNIGVVEINSNYLYKIMDEVDAIVINANFMLEKGYKPSREALYLEEFNVEYTNLLVTKSKSRKLEEVERLRVLLKSPEVKKFIDDKYKESIVIID